MTTKYLDSNGLSYLWGKLKNYFQPKLESGTNIKTINNESLLGSGNIDIQGGSSVFFAEINSTTYDEVADALTAGKMVFAYTPNSYGTYNYYEYTFAGSGVFYFSRMHGQVNTPTYKVWTLDNTDVWTDYTSSLASVWLDMFYPVGSYYETSDVNFDPNVTWGGTWILETAGMVHVSGATSGTYTVSGANSADGAGAKDGGSKDAVVIYHTHKVSSGWQSASGQPDRITYSAVNGGYNNTGNGNVQFLEGVGVSGTDKNMPPYIVVCRWHRTA